MLILSQLFYNYASCNDALYSCVKKHVMPEPQNDIKLITKNMEGYCRSVRHLNCKAHIIPFT
jgi:hypothetical protein